MIIVQDSSYMVAYWDEQDESRTIVTDQLALFLLDSHILASDNFLGEFARRGGTFWYCLGDDHGLMRGCSYRHRTGAGIRRHIRKVHHNGA